MRRSVPSTDMRRLRDSVDHDNCRDTFDSTGTIKQVAFHLSGAAIHDAGAETRRGMSQQ